MTAPRRLTVYRDRRPVGTLWAEGTRLQFAYHAPVLGDRAAAVSVLLPVRWRAVAVARGGKSHRPPRSTRHAAPRTCVRC